MAGAALTATASQELGKQMQIFFLSFFFVVFLDFSLSASLGLSQSEHLSNANYKHEIKISGNCAFVCEPASCAWYIHSDDSQP